MKNLALTLKLTLGFLALTIVFGIAFYLTDFILSNNGLMLRGKTADAFFITIIVTAALFIVFLFIHLVKHAAEKENKTASRVVSGLVAAFLAVILFFGTIFFVTAFSFADQPEHEVTRDGKEMVASVNAFLEVEVNYHEYVNQFVMGKKVLIYEDYGNGGFDPFTQDPMPQVKRVTKFS